MAIGSGEINPIQYWALWQVLQINGVNSPGVIAKNGIRGFERKADWDLKKGKGATAVTLTKSAFPPAEGTIEFLLWEPDHFTQWAAFRPLFRYNLATQADGEAFSLYHPSLADLGIASAVTKEISPIREKGLGMYSVEVTLIEWVPPSNANATDTPNRAAAPPPDAPGATPDPVGDANDKQIAQKLSEYASIGKP